MADMTHERAMIIVEELTGTCKDVDAVLGDDEDAMDPVLCATIDAEIFECETCGWWCEWSEESERLPRNCTDCAPEEEVD